MTWWKLLYDTKTPTWQAFGRVAFVQAASIDEARTAGLAAAAAEYPGAEILPYELNESTVAAADNHATRRQRLAEWARNVKRGEPNTRQTLDSASSPPRVPLLEQGKAIGSAIDSSTVLAGQTEPTP